MHCISGRIALMGIMLFLVACDDDEIPLDWYITKYHDITTFDNIVNIEHRHYDPETSRMPRSLNHVVRDALADCGIAAYSASTHSIVGETDFQNPDLSDLKTLHQGAEICGDDVYHAHHHVIAHAEQQDRWADYYIGIAYVPWTADNVVNGIPDARYFGMYKRVVIQNGCINPGDEAWICVVAATDIINKFKDDMDKVRRMLANAAIHEVGHAFLENDNDAHNNHNDDQGKGGCCPMNPYVYSRWITCPADGPAGYDPYCSKTYPPGHRQQIQEFKFRIK